MPLVGGQGCGFTLPSAQVTLGIPTEHTHGLSRPQGRAPGWRLSSEPTRPFLHSEMMGGGGTLASLLPAAPQAPGVWAEGSGIPPPCPAPPWPHGRGDPGPGGVHSGYQELSTTTQGLT